MNISFEWDEAKAAANLRKHGLGFPTASEALHDRWRFERLDRRDHEEDRFTTIAALNGNALFIVYAVRGDTIRLISAREATRHEALLYWKNRSLHV
jgi:uncharacterized protein